MKRIFCLTLMFFMALWTLHAETNQEKIQQIDYQIEELEDMKQGYEARALRHENLAIYMQFENQAWLETRRHYEIAQENRDKAAYIQTQIDALQREKQRLQKKGFASNPS